MPNICGKLSLMQRSLLLPVHRLKRPTVSTTGLFGDIIDVYDMTQAVQDGATVKIYYESRLAKVKLDEEKMKEIDREYWKLQVHEGVEDYTIEESQKRLSRMEQIIGDEEQDSPSRYRYFGTL